MKHETPTVTAKVRERSGTRYARRLRQQGRLPGVIYGHKAAPVAVSVDEKEILTHVRHGAHAMYVEVEGGKRETCLVKDLQYGFLGDNIIHVDFTRVDMDESVTVKVHLNFVGVSKESQKTDAILRHDMTEVAVKCKVSAIPEEIRVDLGRMKGTVLTAGEITLPAGVTLEEDPESPAASVSFLRKEEEPTGEEVEVDAGAAAEPEVITEAKSDGEEQA